MPSVHVVDMPSVHVDQVPQVPGERDNFYDVKQVLWAHRQLLRNVEHWAYQQLEVTALLLADLESGKSTTAASLLGGSDLAATRVAADMTPFNPAGTSTLAAPLSGVIDLGATRVDANMTPLIPAAIPTSAAVSSGGADLAATRVGDSVTTSIPSSDLDATRSAANEMSSGAASAANNLEPATPASKLSDSALSRLSFCEDEVAHAMSILNDHMRQEEHFVTEALQAQLSFASSRCPILNRLYCACKSKYARCRELGSKAPDRRGPVRACVSSKYFDRICVAVIGVNAIFIAWASDNERANLHQQTSEVRDQVEMGFCTWYIVELILKISCQKWYFFFGEEWQWNYFDAFLVASAIHENTSALLQQDSGVDASFLRILRLSKTLKLLRMVRLMRMFRELRLIMNSIMGSIKSLMWSFLLIAAVLFLFGLCFLQAVTDYLRTDGENVPEDIRQDFDEFWGSVSKSMLSMYMATTGGEDWKRIAQPLWESGGVYYMGFLLYIGFYTCVITNTLTSLFVETTISNAADDQQAAISEELAHKDDYVKMLRSWFTTIDNDNSGTITNAEFVSALQHPEVVSFALEMAIDLPDLKQFFWMLSSNGERGVDLDTFVVGCIKLKGVAKSMDLMDLVFAHKQSCFENTKQFETLHERFLALEGLLAKVLRDSTWQQPGYSQVFS